MIKLIKSTFYNEKKTKERLIDFISNSDILSMSEQCKKFEEDFAKKQQRKYAVLVSSGSSANLVLIQSLLNLGLLKKGDKIGFSSLTWSTNVMPLIQLGLSPMALDCNKETLNVGPKELEKYADGLKGLFLTNVLGFGDNIQEIKEICQKKDIIFFEDNCESLGSQINNTLLGNFGIASTFSFFVGHHLSAIEGGMICTDDEELRDMLIMVRAHGWDRNLGSDKQIEIREKYNIDEFYSKYSFYDLAYNVRSTEITGFIGNEQLQYWDEIISKREDNFKRCNEVIKSNDDFISFNLDHMNVISNFGIPVVCKDKDICEKYKKKFTDAKVENRPIIAGDITRQPFYKKYIDNPETCQNADFIHQNGFYFANNPELTESEISLLLELLQK